MIMYHKELADAFNKHFEFTSDQSGIQCKLKQKMDLKSDYQVPESFFAQLSVLIERLFAKDDVSDSFVSVSKENILQILTDLLFSLPQIFTFLR